MATHRRRWSRSDAGQALVEFALVLPLVALVVFGAITFGLWVFYQQQLTNVAREAARYAAIHSSTALGQTTSWRDPQAPPSTYNLVHDDGPDTLPTPWPKMTSHARSYAWGVDPAAIHVNACWSGYLPSGVATGYPDYSESSGFPQADHPAVADGVANEFIQCTIDRLDPISQTNSLGCRAGMTTDADDPASDIPGNQVTVYACFVWTPPMAGLLMIPGSITMRAIVTEVIHRQQ